MDIIKKVQDCGKMSSVSKVVNDRDRARLRLKESVMELAAARGQEDDIIDELIVKVNEAFGVLIDSHVEMVLSLGENLSDEIHENFMYEASDVRDEAVEVAEGVKEKAKKIIRESFKVDNLGLIGKKDREEFFDKKLEISRKVSQEVTESELFRMFSDWVNLRDARPDAPLQGRDVPHEVSRALSRANLNINSAVEHKQPSATEKKAEGSDEYGNNSGEDSAVEHKQPSATEKKAEGDDEYGLKQFDKEEINENVYNAENVSKRKIIQEEVDLNSEATVKKTNDTTIGKNNNDSGNQMFSITKKSDMKSFQFALPNVDVLKENCNVDKSNLVPGLANIQKINTSASEMATPVKSTKDLVLVKRSSPEPTPETKGKSSFNFMDKADEKSSSIDCKEESEEVKFESGVKMECALRSIVKDEESDITAKIKHPAIFQLICQRGLFSGIQGKIIVHIRLDTAAHLKLFHMEELDPIYSRGRGPEGVEYFNDSVNTLSILLKCNGRLEGIKKHCSTLLDLEKVSMGNKNYVQAMEELTSCLEKGKDKLSDDSREIAQTECQLGVALGYHGQRDEGVKYCSGSVNMLNNTKITVKRKFERPAGKDSYNSVDHLLDDEKYLLVQDFPGNADNLAQAYQFLAAKYSFMFPDRAAHHVTETQYQLKVALTYHGLFDPGGIGLYKQRGLSKYLSLDKERDETSKFSLFRIYLTVYAAGALPIPVTFPTSAIKRSQVNSFNFKFHLLQVSEIIS